jgi:hypothetical protein
MPQLGGYLDIFAANQVSNDMGWLEIMRITGAAILKLG